MFVKDYLVRRSLIIRQQEILTFFLQILNFINIGLFIDPKGYNIFNQDDILETLLFDIL